MKKILLVNPPFYRLMGSHFNGLVLGLSYITSVLSRNGYKVKIYNADFSDNKEYLSQKEIFCNYDGYKRVLNDFENKIWKEIKSEIEAYSPDVVGITMHTGTYKSAKNIAAVVKSISKEIIVVVGGPHPTLDPQGTILNDDTIDFAIRGEGEHTFLELIQGKNKETILGLSYKKENIVIHNPDRPFIENLDLLPFPNRASIINADKHDMSSLITGRGCPFSCFYCASPRLWKGQVRFRSIDNVIQELIAMRDLIGQQIVYFVDDTFSLNKNRTKELCRRMIEEKIDIKWRCDTRVDAVDAEVIEFMRNAGCVRVKIGVESGSERILRMIKKGITKKQIRRTVELFKVRDISVTAYLMAGFPSETREELEETIKFADELDVSYYSLSIFAPYYGTEIYEKLKTMKIGSDGNHWERFFHQSQDMILNDNLDKGIVDKFLALNESPGRGLRL
jgi:radical SAM superfamily enzyme YgiQ (UPF0313 family)